MRILLLNGPNLNLLGTREKEVYGDISLSNIEKSLADFALNEKVDLDVFQSNIEGELVDALHRAAGVKDLIPNISPFGSCCACIFNPGAFTHTSVALRDAVAAIDLPVYEVHISNVLTREDFRHSSIIGPEVSGTIIGFGVEGYLMALRTAIDRHVKGINFL
tara:strand:- start:24622 stop:25107 length:486 start_codon:yes stop_codon:yes gene_type:complete